jgi:hypothetical protein
LVTAYSARRLSLSAAVIEFFTRRPMGGFVTVQLEGLEGRN